MLNGFMLCKMRKEGKVKKGRKGRREIKKSQKEFDMDTRSVGIVISKGRKVERRGNKVTCKLE